MSLNLCLDCPLECKLLECCGVNPETGESAPLILEDNTIIEACPSLDMYGFCTLNGLDSRPQICSDYQCQKFYETLLTNLFL